MSLLGSRGGSDIGGGLIFPQVVVKGNDGNTDDVAASDDIDDRDGIG